MNVRIVRMQFCSLSWGSLAGVDISDVEIDVEGWQWFGNNVIYHPCICFVCLKQLRVSFRNN